MAKFETIKKNEDFQRIFEKGHSISGRYIVVYFLHTSSNQTRFGFCVGKKTGSAVTRNRIRRIFREVIALLQPIGENGLDILIVGRPMVVRADFNRIFGEIKHILWNAGLKSSQSQQNMEDYR